ncbi:MAG: hypothetical protein DCC58_11585 [Chloroflexi bacterium]|nr:MAG: hypothetical protein DCC58_11585 [Chloroflexota bacterium]
MRGYLRRVASLERDVRLFMVYSLFSNLGMGVFALIFNLYLVGLGYNEAFIGAFNAAYTVAMGLACLGLGFLLNRYGAWICILAGTLEFIVASFLLCFLTGPLPLLVLAVLTGVGTAVIQNVQMPFIIEWTPREHTPTAAALASSLNAASIMVGSLVGGMLPRPIGRLLGEMAESVEPYRWTLVAGVFLTVVGIIPVLLMQTTRRQRHHADFHVARTQLVSTGVRRQARRDVGALVLLGLFLALGVGAIEPFYNVLLDGMGVPASRIGLIFALSGLAATLLSLAGPALFRRFGPVVAQTTVRMCHVPFHLLLLVFPTPLVVSLAYGTRRISGSMAWPIESAHVGSLLPAPARAHAFGLRSASWNFGFAVAALASGWVIATTGSYAPAYIAVGIFCTLSVLVYVVNYGWRGVERTAGGAAVVR